MWHVSSRSGVATLRTAIHLLLTYLLITKRTDNIPSPPTKRCRFIYLRFISLFLSYNYIRPFTTRSGIRQIMCANVTVHRFNAS